MYNTREELYEWMVKYPGEQGADFALFVHKGDAEAFLAIIKLIDMRDYEIAKVSHD